MRAHLKEAPIHRISHGRDVGTSAPPPPSVPASASAERVRRRAYEIFQARKGGPGDALTDWIQAERELAQAAALERHEAARGEALLHDQD